jgi:pimeloyl-ACP methyl ester carboxylesterase
MDEHSDKIAGAGSLDTAGSPHDNASVAARLGGQAITIAARGCTFSAYSAQPRSGDAPTSPLPVLMVHGWPQFATCWEGVAQCLLAAGHAVHAYDQRGYSPGARPQQVELYRLHELVADLRAIADALGLARFHLVGHDWGGIVGWAFTAMHPDRLATYTAVSTSHPKAHAQRMNEDPEQHRRMQYLRNIQEKPERTRDHYLGNGGLRLDAIYENAIPADVRRSYIARLCEPGVMDAVLKYYRAMGLGEEAPMTPITVPTQYIWGSGDVAFTRDAALLTADYVEGDYRFLPLEGATHWLPEERAEDVAQAILEWSSRYPR